MRFKVCTNTYTDVTDIFSFPYRTYFIKLDFSKKCKVLLCGFEFVDISFIDVPMLEHVILTHSAKENNGSIELVKSPIEDIDNLTQVARLRAPVIEITPMDTAENIPIKITYVYIRDTKSKLREKDLPTILNEDNKKQVETEKLSSLRAKWINSQLILGKKIWDEVNEALESTEFAKLDTHQQMKYFQSTYPKFNKQHPLVLRYMVDAQLFHFQAYEKYIIKVADTPPQKRESFYERQADYAVLLYKAKSKHFNTVKVKQIWERTFAELKNESEMFKNMQDYADDIDENLQKKIISDISFSLEKQINELRKQYIENKQIFKVPKKFAEYNDSSGDEYASIETFAHLSNK